MEDLFLCKWIIQWVKIEEKEGRYQLQQQQQQQQQ